MNGLIYLYHKINILQGINEVNNPTAYMRGYNDALAQVKQILLNKLQVDANSLPDVIKNTIKES
jgi:hypothetical protein